MFSNKAPKKDSYLGYYFLQGAWKEITIGNFSILQLVTLRLLQLVTLRLLQLVTLRLLQLVTLSKTVATSNFVENCCN
jgi:hypothetical protein